MTEVTAYGFQYHRDLVLEFFLEFSRFEVRQVGLHSPSQSRIQFPEADLPVVIQYHNLPAMMSECR